MGIGQWIGHIICFDILFGLTNLSCFSVAPWEEHIACLHKVFGFLKCFPDRGIIVNPLPLPFFQHHLHCKQLAPDFGSQYQDFVNPLDIFPDQLGKELPIGIYVDANLAHDKKTGRSCTGVLPFVGSLLVNPISKRQGAVTTSTFGAKFAALKTGVDVWLAEERRSPLRLHEVRCACAIQFTTPQKMPVRTVYSVALREPTMVRVASSVKMNVICFILFSPFFFVGLVFGGEFSA